MAGPPSPSGSGAKSAKLLAAGSGLLPRHRLAMESCGAGLVSYQPIGCRGRFISAQSRTASGFSTIATIPRALDQTISSLEQVRITLRTKLQRAGSRKEIKRRCVFTLSLCRGVAHTGKRSTTRSWFAPSRSAYTPGNVRRKLPPRWASPSNLSGKFAEIRRGLMFLGPLVLLSGGRVSLVAERRPIGTDLVVGQRRPDEYGATSSRWC